MKTNWKSLALQGALVCASLGLSGTQARAQGFSFGYTGPGISVGVTTPGYGYYGGAYAPGYPVVSPGPVLVRPVPPVVVGGPVLVRRPIFGPGYVYGPRRVYGGFYPRRAYYYGR